MTEKPFKKIVRNGKSMNNDRKMRSTEDKILPRKMLKRSSKKKNRHKRRKLTGKKRKMSSFSGNHDPFHKTTKNRLNDCI